MFYQLVKASTLLGPGNYSQLIKASTHDRL